MKDTFKTLVFKGDRTKILGQYAHFVGNDTEWYGGSMPMLMSAETTLEKLKEYRPDMDYSKVVLKTIKVVLQK